MPSKIGMDVIVPQGGLYDTKALDRAIDNALNETAAAIKVDFEVTQRTWTHKAGFRIRKKRWEREISTGDEPYPWVDFGTKPHIIRPVKAQALAFQGNYKPKTFTGQILSRSGGSSGPTIVRPEVQHPGTDPGKFSETIAKKWEKEWPRQLQRAINAEV